MESKILIRWDNFIMSWFLFLKCSFLPFFSWSYIYSLRRLTSRTYWLVQTTPSLRARSLVIRIWVVTQGSLSRAGMFPDTCCMIPSSSSLIQFILLYKTWITVLIFAGGHSRSTFLFQTTVILEYLLYLIQLFFKKIKPLRENGKNIYTLSGNSKWKIHRLHTRWPFDSLLHLWFIYYNSHS